MNDQLEEAMSHIKEWIFDEEHFTARALKAAKDRTDVDEEYLAMGCAALLSLYLLFGSRAQHLANLLLITIPLLFTYVFIEERPSTERLQVYWGCFTVSLLLDILVGDKMAGYYLLKTFFFLCLFLRPFLWADKILQVITNYATNQQPFTPPEPIITPQEPIITAQEPITTPQEPITTAISASTTASEPSSLTAVENNENPMRNDPRHQLLPTNGEQEVPINFNDIIFQPASDLVFNAPQESLNLNCFLRMTSNSTHHIAFALKSNCVDRLTATPACGILAPKQALIVAVSIPTYEMRRGGNPVAQDRLAIDYTFCSPDTPGFSFSLLQVGHRRKNIYIKYNF